MRVVPLAFDSLGTRSMCTYVVTPSLSILIDPGVALGPIRYGFEPHPLEYKKEIEHWSSIENHAKKSDIIIVTHYHHDHFNPDKPHIFKDKVALVKHPTEKINKSQKRRASAFLADLERYASEVRHIDGQEFEFKNVKIKFSEPVFHGPDGRAGWVVQVFVDDGKTKFIYTSDIEGAIHEKQLEFIKKNNPEIIVMDGPLTYLMGYSFSYDQLKKSIKNLKEILKMKSVKTVILDHHFMRDLRWNDRIVELYPFAKKHDAKIMPASRYIGESLNMLESKRRELWTKK